MPWRGGAMRERDVGYSVPRTIRRDDSRPDRTTAIGPRLARRFRRLRPIVVVLEDPDYTRALAAAVLLHLYQHGKKLAQLRARFVLAVEGQYVAAIAAHV